MNWVGGARNRIKLKHEKKIQKEFFERKRHARKVFRSATTSSPGERDGKVGLGVGVSQDLIALNTLMKAHDKPSRKTVAMRRPVKIDMDRTPPKGLGRHASSVKLPESPTHHEPSSLELVTANDDKSNAQSELKLVSCMSKLPSQLDNLHHDPLSVTTKEQPNPKSGEICMPKLSERHEKLHTMPAETKREQSTSLSWNVRPLSFISSRTTLEQGKPGGSFISQRDTDFQDQKENAYPIMLTEMDSGRSVDYQQKKSAGISEICHQDPLTFVGIDAVAALPLGSYLETVNRPISPGIEEPATKYQRMLEEDPIRKRTFNEIESPYVPFSAPGPLRAFSTSRVFAVNDNKGSATKHSPPTHSLNVHEPSSSAETRSLPKRRSLPLESPFQNWSARKTLDWSHFQLHPGYLDWRNPFLNKDPEATIDDSRDASTISVEPAVFYPNKSTHGRLDANDYERSKEDGDCNLVSATISEKGCGRSTDEGNTCLSPPEIKDIQNVGLWRSFIENAQAFSKFTTFEESARVESSDSSTTAAEKKENRQQDDAKGNIQGNVDVPRNEAVTDPGRSFETREPTKEALQEVMDLERDEVEPSSELSSSWSSLSDDDYNLSGTEDKKSPVETSRTLDSNEVTANTHALSPPIVNVSSASSLAISRTINKSDLPSMKTYHIRVDADKKRNIIEDNLGVTLSIAPSNNRKQISSGKRPDNEKKSDRNVLLSQSEFSTLEASSKYTAENRAMFLCCTEIKDSTCSSAGDRFKAGSEYTNEDIKETVSSQLGGDSVQPIVKPPGNSREQWTQTKALSVETSDCAISTGTQTTLTCQIDKASQTAKDNSSSLHHYSCTAKFACSEKESCEKDCKTGADKSSLCRSTLNTQISSFEGTTCTMNNQKLRTEQQNLSWYQSLLLKLFAPS